MLPPVRRLLSVSVARAGLRSYPLVHSASGQCAGSSPVSSHPCAILGRGSGLVRTVAVQHQLPSCASAAAGAPQGCSVWSLAGWLQAAAGRAVVVSASGWPLRLVRWPGARYSVGAVEVPAGFPARERAGGLTCRRAEFGVLDRLVEEAGS